MGIRLPSIIQKVMMKRNIQVKGCISVYVGDERKRFVIPISCLSHPSFLDLLHLAEQEFGFNHPMGGLTLPCTQDAFIDLISNLDQD